MKYAAKTNISEIYAKRAQSYLEGKNPDEQDVFWIPTPGQITLLSNVIIDIITAIKKCVDSPEAAVNVAHNPNKFQQGMLKRVTRRKIGWWRYYNPFGYDYVKAVGNAGKDVTNEDMGELFYEETVAVS